MNSQPNERAAAMPAAHPVQRRVLVVDDDAGIREMLSQALEDEGYRVECAGNGAHALELLRAAPELPCLILLDMKMPIMDGAEFCAQQQQEERLADVPVLVLTANRNHQTERERLFAANVLDKPIKLMNLLEAVRKLGC